MTEWVIGCTHFGHARIIELAGRPFKSVEEMDETMTSNWNRVVRPGDTVYHLGDFAYRAALTREYYEFRLNGRIVKIQGNHDPENWGRDLHTITRHKTKIVLCHYPISEWNNWWRGSIHLHAHTHGRTFKTAERRGNVGVDAIDFTPLRIEEAIERLKAL